MFPPHTDNFQIHIKFKSDMGNEFFGKKGEKPSEEKPEPKESPKPKPKPKPFHCDHYGREGHLAEFCFRRKREESWIGRWPTRTGNAPLMVCLSLGWCPGARVCCVPFTLERGVSLCLEVSHHIEKVVGVLGLGVVSLLDVPSLVANTSIGGMITVLGPRGAIGVSPSWYA
jgi:hypothetical protein